VTECLDLRSCTDVMQLYYQLFNAVRLRICHVLVTSDDRWMQLYTVDEFLSDIWSGDVSENCS
jgi:hypothetical protein